MIPGRRTLISEFSALAAFTKDVKYISPGFYKTWTEKHNGIVRHLPAVPQNSHPGLGYRAQEVWLGCHK